jgi:hypothetical protein
MRQTPGFLRVGRDWWLSIRWKNSKSSKNRKAMPFPKGQSGSPNGRARGSGNRATPAMQFLLDGEGEASTRKAVVSPSTPIQRHCAFFAASFLLFLRPDPALSTTWP